jgi:hypothetical protein
MTAAVAQAYAEMSDRARAQGFTQAAVPGSSLETLVGAIRGHVEAKSHGTVHGLHGGARALAELAHVVPVDFGSEGTGPPLPFTTRHTARDPEEEAT